VERGGLGFSGRSSPLKSCSLIIQPFFL
jgi:hypothetical protein